MASNNSFMTDLLALLDNEDNLMKVVTSEPSSSTAPFDVKYYLTIIEEILDHATAVAENTQPKGNHVQSKSLTSPSKEISSTITELCCQITCRAQHTNNVGKTLASIFDQLSSFPWGARAVLTLLALTMHYAEKWRLTQIEESDELLCLMARLRGLHATGKFPDTQRSKAFLEISNLIRVTLEFTRCIVENDSEDFREFTTTINISDCFKYITVFVLGCSVEFSGMISAGNEFQGRDLSTFSVRVTKKQESFKKLVEVFVQKNEEKLLYKKIRKLYSSGADITEFMALLFCNGKDSPTVTRGLEKTPAEVKQLQNKKVMLLISDLTLSDNDIYTLNSIYTVDLQTNYEIMWVPIADVKDDEQFQKKRKKMPWYSCSSVVSKAATRFIKKYWQFKQQTKVVVLNQEGEVVNKDAMTMIRLWRAEAFPFTPDRGCKLWDTHSSHWLKLLVQTTVSQSVQQSWETKQLIFFYGSAEDSKTVEQIDDVLESKKETFKFTYSNVKTKRKQFLSCLEDCISWKMQVNKGMTDSQTLQLLELYNRYKQQSGFAIVTRGSSVLVNTSLSDLGKVLSEHTRWITKETNRFNFDTHFHEYYKKVFVMPKCSQFSIPIMDGDIPACIKCPKGDCGRDMEIIVTYKCCHDKH